MNKKRNIVVLSGAGISAESGISTFRDSNGLWENYRIEEVATPDAWRQNPDLVTRFYNERRAQILRSEPNKAHYSIAQLEYSENVFVITQNIDDLHERSGSKNVLHLHGNILLSKSSGPNQEQKYYPVIGENLSEKDVCPDGYRLRPHVVWFGEAVPEYDRAISIIQKADILLVVGTSLKVYPAAGLTHYAPTTCKRFILDPNSHELDVSSNFERIVKSACEGIQDFIDRI